MTHDEHRRPRRAEPTGHQASPADIAIGVVIGRSSEFFDFFVYAIASVLVFPRVMFPFAEPLEAMLWSFAIFALGFIARPLGTLIFMAIDRRWGRGVKLTLALFLLGCSTAGIAFMPDYSLAGGLRDPDPGGDAHRPGHGARRRLGRAGLAARDERAARTSAAGTR